jgi:hypothetical protein
VFDGAPEIKIKSADQKTADFVSEKDVRARSKADQKQIKSRSKADQTQAEIYLIWRSKCGRGGATIRLAPDEGVSADTAVTDPQLSRASPLPHF